MDNNINKILRDIANAAADTAASARTAVRNVKEMLEDKCDTVKLNFEYNQLEEQQEKIFSDTGRMLFLMHTKRAGESVKTQQGEKTPQQVVDSLLLTAEQLQQQLDAIQQKIEEYQGQNNIICSQCGNRCMKEDHFCSHCGCRLSQIPQVLL